MEQDARALALTFQQALVVQGRAMDVVKQEFEKHVGDLVEQAKQAYEEAQAFDVIDDESAQRALDFGSRMGKLEKQMDGRRVDFVGPHNNFVSWMNGQFKKFALPVTDAKSIVKGKLSAYLIAKQERARKTAEAAIREAQEKAKATGETAPVIIGDIPGRSIRSAGGTFTVSQKWAYQVVDEAAIPMEYKRVILNESKIQADIDAGVREIQGLLIYLQPTGSITPRKG